MKILSIVYKLGGTSPTGVTNKRTLDALVRHGHQVYVISAPTVDNTWHNEFHHECSNFPTSPAVVLTKLGNLLQRDMNFIFWEKRVFSYARKLISHEKPDVIYARSSPSAVCNVAARLAGEFQIPLFMHFTDPIPAPQEWAPDPKYRSRQIKLMNRILPKANMISFGNEFMANYQQKITPYDFSRKVFISPDPSSSSTLNDLEDCKHDVLTLVFLGAIHGSRNPKPLFNAIRELNMNGVKSSLVIYDGKESFTEEAYVLHAPRTTNVKKVITDADILVDIDGEDAEPVFISSKLKDYITFTRPILSITSENSPSRLLLSGMNTVFFSSNKEDELLKTILAIKDTAITNEEYLERQKVIETFDANNIARELAQKMASFIEIE